MDLATFGFRSFSRRRKCCIICAVDVRALLDSEWWRDVCVLFAKMDGHFEWLIESLPIRDLSKLARGTIGAMIRARPPQDQQLLRQAVKNRLAKTTSALVDPEWERLLDEECDILPRRDPSEEDLGWLGKELL